MENKDRLGNSCRFKETRDRASIETTGQMEQDCSLDNSIVPVLHFLNLTLYCGYLRSFPGLEIHNKEPKVKRAFLCN